jgi:hypothetical protein
MAEGCERCGAPLAEDQHYCLECGQRTGSPRVDYRHYMAAAPQGEGQGDVRPAQPTEPGRPSGFEEPDKPQRDYAPLAAVGGIAVLGLMLLIGVLIGKGNGDTAAAPAPQIVRVQGGGEEGGSEEGSGSTKSTGLGLSGGGGGSQKAKQGGGSSGTGKAVKASEGDLESLGNTSGEDYVKQSENLPNEIATPGAPPPIDKSKPPGGGEGGGEVIK